MPSYFRNLFGGHSSSKSSSGHSRSNSTPTAPIYAPAGPTASGSTGAMPSMQRSYSHSARSNTPSPLRYDTRTAYGYGRAAPAPASHHGHGSQPEPRTHTHRRASFKTPDTRKHLLLPSASVPSHFFHSLPSLRHDLRTRSLTRAVCSRSALGDVHAVNGIRDAAELALQLERVALPVRQPPAHAQLRSRPRAAPAAPEPHLAPLGHCG